MLVLRCDVLAVDDAITRQRAADHYRKTLQWWVVCRAFLYTATQRLDRTPALMHLTYSRERVTMSIRPDYLAGHAKIASHSPPRRVAYISGAFTSAGLDTSRSSSRRPITLDDDTLRTKLMDLTPKPVLARRRPLTWHHGQAYTP